jgi:SAM-dependent methyltransferase
MNLTNLVNRKTVPNPWEEGDNIPWNDPGFSQRMLKEHLSQDHDAASRRFDRIDQHVAWIHDHALKGKTSKILDLGCGPGLYSHRLAKQGHRCHGIDYSPASIAYARQVAHEEKLNCTFLEADIREADYGREYDAAMLVYGELNVFQTAHAEHILKKAHHALQPGGVLILEPHTFEAVQDWGSKPAYWASSGSGLFSPEPHLVLEEYFWDPDARVTTNRYYLVDASTGEVTSFAQSVEAYTQQEYAAMLEKCGYTGIHFYPSLSGEVDHQQKALIAILASRTG